MFKGRAGFWKGMTAALLLLAVVPAQARHAALVVDADSGEVLHAVEATSNWYPASLTKMMTLYLTLEALTAGRLSLDDRLPVSAHAASMSPTKLGLAAGETVLARDALMGIIVRSANDAAVVLAEYLAQGSEPSFVANMNRKARELGMLHTTYRNPSGLPDSEQISTAYDLAVLARALRRDFPQHYHLFATREFRYRGATLHSTNTLLTTLSGADGLKTGFTCASGFNIVVSAQRDSRRLIGVVLGAHNRFARNEQIAGLLNDAFRSGSHGDGRTLADLGREFSAESPPHQIPGCGGAPAPVEMASIRRGSPAARALTSSPQSWSALVGVFRTRAAAQQALARAVDPVAAGHGTVVPRGRGYAVHVAGLSQGDAAAFCAQPLERKVGCVVTRSRASPVRLAQSASSHPPRKPVRRAHAPRPRATLARATHGRALARLGQGG